MTGLLASDVAGCGDDLAGSAAKSAALIRGIRSNTPKLEVGDIEPYPAQRPAQIVQWLLALNNVGLAPAYLHLDANIHFLDLHPEINVTADLQSLQVSLRTLGIPFGIIFWSGYDPEPSDQAYFDHTMNWVRRVHAAIGAPDQAIFQSWIYRSFPGCSDTDPNCGPPKLRCPPEGARGCGLKSVPVNLPEGDPEAFSLIRLVNEALGTLRQ